MSACIRKTGVGKLSEICACLAISCGDLRQAHFFHEFPSLPDCTGLRAKFCGTMMFGKMEGDASIAFMLQDDEADGPYYHM